ESGPVADFPEDRGAVGAVAEADERDQHEQLQLAEDRGVIILRPDLTHIVKDIMSIFAKFTLRARPQPTIIVLMSFAASSTDAIRTITDFSVRSAAARRKATDEFGSLTFNEETQRARLPKDVFRALRRSIAHGESLDPSIADIVASALKDWAVEHGATH